MPASDQPLSLRRLYEGVLSLWESTITLEQEFSDDIGRVPADRRASARNLVHYLAVRRRDIRALQMELRNLGLSSLGRLEAQVSAALESVLMVLSQLADVPLPSAISRAGMSRFRDGDQRLAEHTDALFGPPRSHDARVRVMVTMPTRAATDHSLVRSFVAAGMDVARINAAHDSPNDWKQMANNVRAAAAEHGRSIRILLDLAGPKLRTGTIAAGPAVLRVKAKRNRRGTLTHPARFRLVRDRPRYVSTDSLPEIPTDPEFFESISEGDQVVLRDASGRRRKIDIVSRDENGALAEARATLWFESGLPLRLLRGREKVQRGHVGQLPARPAVIRLHKGDKLILTANPEPGRDAVRDETGRVTEPARIPCTLPAVFKQVRKGERILFDDGVIVGQIEAVATDMLQLRITQTRPRGGKLRSDKGINLPDTNLDLAPVQETDLAALDLAVKMADIVGLSFIRKAADLEALHSALIKRRAENLGVIVKIETQRGFEHLPQILLTALRHPPVGVMVARGDLGVEVGFERMSEVQEEVLWLCEAAHVPVIWATQVLDGLIKTGMPTRGEVTDAAMSARAECVMLNKGPYIEKAIIFLENVLTRMLDHHIKKTPMLRRLKVSEGRWGPVRYTEISAPDTPVKRETGG